MNNTANDAQHTGRLLLGWATLDDLLSAHTERAVGAQNDHATAVLVEDQLRDPLVNYLGEAAVEVVVDLASHRLFTGLVERVVLRDGEAHIDLAGNQRELQEIKTGGLVVGDGSDAREMVHSVLRSAGWPSGKISIPGWTPGPREPFLVASPIEGVDVAAPRSIGGVEVTTTNPCRLDMPISHALVDEFQSAKAWIFTTVAADTIYDAEIAGRARLDLGISTLRLFGAYSYPVLGGELRPYDRDQSRAQVRQGDAVFVGSIVSRRRWLRSVHNLDSWPTLKIDGTTPTISPDPLPNEVEPLLARAIRESAKSRTFGDRSSATRLGAVRRGYSAGAKHDRQDGVCLTQQHGDTISVRDLKRSSRF